MFYFKPDALHIYFCQSTMSMTFINNGRVKNSIFFKINNELFVSILRKYFTVIITQHVTDQYFQSNCSTLDFDKV